MIVIKRNSKCKERKDITTVSIERTIEISCAYLDPDPDR